MQLSAEQLAAYDRDGFLVIPNLLGPDEVALLKAELARVGDIHDERIVRERTGGPRIVYGLHEKDGPTASRAYEALVRSPRILQPAKDMLRDDVYVYHTKANTKMALEGAIYEWHQDYINWRMMDGPPEPRILTAMVMLDKSTEVGGCLYFIPGSHKLGMVKPDLKGQDEDKAMDAVRFHAEPMSVPKSKMAEVVRTCGEPVAILGEPGTVAFFHGDMIHGSGHNMSVHSRWILYIVYNAHTNRPLPVPKPRQEFKAARTAPPTQPLDYPSIVSGVAHL